MERKSVKVVESNKVGRPTAYDPTTHPERAYKLCMIGLTDEQLGLAFGIAPATVGLWRRNHPEFALACQRGKEEADAVVAQSLFHRAKGYSHPEEVIKVIDGEIVKVDTTKHYPPDTTACIFWLKNRQRQNWRDVWAMEHTGKDGKPLELNVKAELKGLDLSNLSDQELEMVAAIGFKIKKNSARKAELTYNDETEEDNEIVDIEADAEAVNN